jgi:pyrimidine-nucleoside phosphorylase
MVLVQDIILSKRSGAALSKKQIDYFVSAYTAGDIPDYQAAALLMAIWFRGMDERETTELTLAIRDSGDIVDLSPIDGLKLDKHSTGGVADTTTLIAAPLVAACGGRVAKISGRGLGHTGGTIDKLESIPGLQASVTLNDFVRIVADCGLAIVAQSANLVPADRKLYALRDVTATVDNISLISSSIMSKKLASGADRIVLDVKVGSGAFMDQLDTARELAGLMVAIGRRAGHRTSALVTDMNQPLGRAVGNALEVQEAIAILRGECRGDLKSLSLELAAEMLLSAELASSREAAMVGLESALGSGRALQHLGQMIQLLGGDPRVCSDPSILPRAAEEVVVRAERGGFINQIRTAQIGSAALLLGAGRTKKDAPIDPAVGLKMEVRLGDRVHPGDALARVYVNDRKNLQSAVEQIQAAVLVGEQRVEPPPLIYEHIRD